MTVRKGHLALADGTVFSGCLFGASSAAVGEVVFTTGMTGYQEVLTDPSYAGQIVTMTAPQIGNTGVNPDDPESIDARPQVAGFIVRENSPTVSNWRATESLDAYLARHGIAAIEGVDTRKLTRHLRDRGAQNGAIGSEPPDTLVDRARQAPSMEGLDLVAKVTPKQRYAFAESRGSWAAPFGSGAPSSRTSPHVVAVDYGAKRNIFRCLVDVGCRVTVVPASASSSDILAQNPDGIFLSNGPGDPAAVTYAVSAIRESQQPRGASSLRPLAPCPREWPPGRCLEPVSPPRAVAQASPPSRAARRRADSRTRIHPRTPTAA
jgi:carbamoyl-phosphate synthase small subunit